MVGGLTAFTAHRLLHAHHGRHLLESFDDRERPAPHVQIEGGDDHAFTAAGQGLAQFRQSVVIEMSLVDGDHLGPLRDLRQGVG
jgi:hypothetical protein